MARGFFGKHPLAWINVVSVRTLHYEGWEEGIIWQPVYLFESATGAPKILDARRALSRYAAVQPMLGPRRMVWRAFRAGTYCWIPELLGVEI